ncbi:toxin-antitoxin system YwqK family antitoxin [Chitinophaga tropicalis]|uniref:MORN repeat variant n=1 Tax=Chitinophaga tropicalis TaxID=2683588 RepID=A0A7K1UDV7_9BACT|nr:hypothetical protein [Chitinophaga tropicalis]MVT12460.1 hypothetical protein [Chitinophaga tropicalis]
MKRLIVFSMLQFSMLAAFSQMVVVKENRVDAQQRKQGEWQEEMPEVKGEPGYSWEGTYIDNLKEGVWKKYALSGGIIAEETFKRGILNGRCRYFYSNGMVSAEGSWQAVDLDERIESYRVIDPVTGEERFEEIKRTATALRTGIWKVYDEEGQMSKEYYKHGESVSQEEYEAYTHKPVAPEKDKKKPATQPPAPPSLPHQKKKG